MLQHNTRPSAGLRRLILCIVLLVSTSGSAHAASLRIVITWDHDYPLYIAVARPSPSSDHAVSHRTPACNRVQNLYLDRGTITASPQIGRGPVEFNMATVPADIDLQVGVRVDYCPDDNRNAMTNDLPRPPANVTIHVFEDGELIYTATKLTGGSHSHPAYTLLYRYKMDSWIDFDLAPYAGTDLQRMIVNAHRTDVPSVVYASPWQEPTAPGEKPRFRINGRLMTRRGSLPETPIYLRVLDPPDESDYVALAGLAANNDNADPEKRGRLEASDGTAAVDGAVLPVLTDSSGHFSVILRGTSRYAGDNYLVEGSGESTFLCASQPSGCGRSGVITAWKRAYVEHSYMFKRSAFIKLPQDPVKKTLVVASSGSELCVGCMARLIHTPHNGGTDFYYEDAKITALKRNAKTGDYTVTLDRALTKAFGPAPQRPGETAPPTHWADAIGIIDTAQFPNGDYYFSTNASYLNQVFPAAFVEIIFLPERMFPRALIPHVPVFAAGVNAANTDAVDAWIDAFSRRWYLNAGRPNHQHLVAADRNVDDNNFGRAVSTLGHGLAHVFMGKVTGAFGLSAADWRLAGEITVHELAHNWHVDWDLIPAAHCDAVMFNDRSRTCTMFHALNYNVYGQCTDTVCPEYSDGLVGFHFRSADKQSEYMYIRNRREPMPFDKSMEP